MSKTVNRQPFITDVDYRKLNTNYFLHSQFKGKQDNKNDALIDPNTFADCRNVYIDTDENLVSRAPIKLINDKYYLTDEFNVNGYNCKVYNYTCVNVISIDNMTPEEYFTNSIFPTNVVTIIIIDKCPQIIYSSFSTKNSLALHQLKLDVKITSMKNYLIVWLGGVASYIFNTTTNSLENIKDYIYKPITKLVVNNIEQEQEDTNYLSDVHIKRYLYSKDSSIKYAVLKDDDLYKVSYSNNTVDNVRPLYTLKWHDNTLNRYSMIYPIGKIDISKISYYDFVSTPRGYIFMYAMDNDIFFTLDFIKFTVVPSLVGRIGKVYLSRDGFSLFAFTDINVMVCDIIASDGGLIDINSTLSWNAFLSMDKVITGDRIITEEMPAYGYFYSKTRYGIMFPFKKEGSNVSMYSYVVDGATHYTRKYYQKADLYSSDYYLYFSAAANNNKININLVGNPIYYIVFKGAWDIENDGPTNNHYSDYYTILECKQDGADGMRIRIIFSKNINSDIFDSNTIYFNEIIQKSNYDGYTYELYMSYADPSFSNIITLRFFDDVVDDTYKLDIYGAETSNIRIRTYINPVATIDTEKVSLSQPINLPNNNSIKFYNDRYFTLGTSSKLKYKVDTDTKLEWLSDIQFDLEPSISKFSKILSIDDNDIFYISEQGNIYTNKLTDNTILYLDIEEGSTYNLLIPDYTSIIDKTYHAYNNDKNNTNIVIPNEDRYDIDKQSEGIDKFLLYFPIKNRQSFLSKITNLNRLSDSIIGIFTENDIWYISSTTENGKTLYYAAIKTKLPVGLRDGDDVIIMLNGQAILFPTTRGIVMMAPQDFVATTDMQLQYLSDDIQSSYEKFYEDKNYVQLIKDYPVNGVALEELQLPIKIRVYKYWIIFYKRMSNRCLWFDTRNNSWWPIEVKYPIQDIICTDSLKFIFRISTLSPYYTSTLITNYFSSLEGLEFLYSSKEMNIEYTDELPEILQNEMSYDDTLIGFYINHKYYPATNNDIERISNTTYKMGVPSKDINWYLVSQKLNFGQPVNYKKILAMYMTNKGDDTVSIELSTKAYRDSYHPEKTLVMQERINDIRTFVKRMNIIHVTDFQYEIKQDKSSDIQKQFRLNSLTIKYEIKEVIR